MKKPKPLKITDAMRRHLIAAGAPFADFVEGHVTMEDAILALQKRSYALGVEEGERNAKWKIEDEIRHKAREMWRLVGPPHVSA